MELSTDEINLIRYIRFTPAVDYFSGQQHDRQMLVQAFETVEGYVKEDFQDSLVDIKPFYHRLEDLHAPKCYSVCRGSGWYAEIGPNGDVYLCCEKLFMPSFKIGNLIDQSLEDIFLGQRRKDVLRRVNKLGCSCCPPLCKPHELNKVLERFEAFRNAQAHEDWVREALDCYVKTTDSPYRFAPGKFNDFES